MNGRWSVGAVLAAGLLAEFAYALLLFPLLQHDLVFNRGFSAAWPGYALAAYGIARLATQLPLGELADRLSRRAAVIVGYVVVLIGGLALWPEWPGPAVLAAAAVFGVGHALADPLLPAALSDGRPIDERGRLIGLLNLAQVLGLALGLGGGAFIVGLMPSAAGFAVVAAANGLALVLLTFVAAPLLRYRPRTSARTGWRTTLRALANTRVVDLYLVLFLLALAMNIILPNIDVYSVERLGRPLYRVVPWLIPAGLLGVAALPLGGWLADRFGRVPPLLAGVVLALAGFIQLGTTRDLAGAGIGAALAGGGLALTVPPSNTAVLDIADIRHRALVLSGMMAVQGLGQAVGPLLGGIIAQGVGVAAVFFIGAALLGVCVPVAGLFARAMRGVIAVDGAEAGRSTPFAHVAALDAGISTEERAGAGRPRG